MTAHRGFGELARVIHASPARLGDVRLVTVDGPSGSGKTTFARRLVTALWSQGSVALVEIEALYEGWTLDGAWQRLHDGVLEPLAAGRSGGFHPYDWATDRWSPHWCPVPVGQVLVVEGCGSSPRVADRLTSLQAWIEAAPEVALARTQARDLARQGTDLDRQLRAWKTLEAAHFAEQDTRQRSDLRVDGDPARPFTFDPEIFFSTLP